MNNITYKYIVTLQLLEQILSMVTLTEQQKKDLILSSLRCVSITSNSSSSSDNTIP